MVFLTIATKIKEAQWNRYEGEIPGGYNHAQCKVSKREGVFKRDILQSGTKSKNRLMTTYSVDVFCEFPWFNHQLTHVVMSNKKEDGDKQAGDCYSQVENPGDQDVAKRDDRLSV